jgi:hypothetical protein
VCAQVFGFVLVSGLLLVSLSTGMALTVARQRADVTAVFSKDVLQDRMRSVHFAADTMASDIGHMGAAQLGSGKWQGGGCRTCFVSSLAALVPCSAFWGWGSLEIGLQLCLFAKLCKYFTSSPATPTEH